MPLLIVPGYPAVSYVEHVPGSPNLTFSHGGSRCERTFVIAYGDLEAFTKGMLGFPRLVAAVGQARPNDTFISRVLPQALPNFSDAPGQDSPWLYAVGVTSVKPAGCLGTVDGNG